MESERVLCVKSPVFVYKIPSRSTNKAPRAAEWDLANPNWEGNLKIIENDKKLRIDLVDKTGALFGSCPIDSHPGPSVEGVSDSSRYFIIKLVNDNGKHAFIGIGFTERNDSFDFNCTIYDFFSKDARMEAMRKEFQKGPAVDLRLKAGQKLNFDISGLVNRNPNQMAFKPSTQRMSTKSTKVCTVLLPDESGDAPSSANSQKTSNSTHAGSSLLPSDLFESTSPSNLFDSNNNIVAGATSATSNPLVQNDLSDLFASSTATYLQQAANPLDNLFSSNTHSVQQLPVNNMFSNVSPNMTHGMGYVNEQNQIFQQNSAYGSGAGMNVNASFIPSQPMHSQASTASDPFASFVQNEVRGASLQNPSNHFDSDLFNFSTTNKSSQQGNNNNFQDPFF